MPTATSAKPSITAWASLWSTDMLERVHEEINHKTRVAGLFPNQASLLRLVSAVLMELSEEWETGKRYLNMDV
jgi:putative transposase